MTIRDELAPILQAIAIQSPAVFQFRGETVNVTPGPVQPLPGFPNHPLPQSPLVRELQATLYGRCYAQRFDSGWKPATTFTPDPSFLSRLSQGNRTQSRWEGGWMVYGVAPTGQISVQKGDRQRFAMPGEYLSLGVPGVPPQQGSMVNIYVPRESAAAQPGFYFTYGEVLSDVWDEHNLLRFYFDVPSDATADLLDYLTRALNRFQIPFRMKALSDPGLYPRTDATVLYIAKRYHSIGVKLLREMPRVVAEKLQPATPLFTKPLAPGVGFAEDPNTGESFGMQRCRMTAQGIADAWMAGDSSVEGRFKAIGEQFKQNGYNLDAPYLGPGSAEFPDIPMTVDFAYE
jgi:HopA1 effector protein family